MARKLQIAGVVALALVTSVLTAAALAGYNFALI